MPKHADLGALGASPRFATTLHVGQPNLPQPERMQQAIAEVLARHRVTNDGPSVHALEDRVATQLDVKHCVATCNGTIALQLLVRALELSGEVIVPAFTFVATAHALQWEGIKPVFCDIDSNTHNLDPARIEAAITSRTSGILGVHLWGRPCAVESLAEIAQRHGLTLLFDAAHAFGCSHGGRWIANFGSAEVFSFHATKFFHSFEGGAVTTNDNDLAEHLRRMRNHGFAGIDNVVSLGINGKMNEICAAVGLTMLEHLDELIAVNKRNYHRYRQRLGEIPGMRLCAYDDSQPTNYQYVVVEVDDRLTGLTRDELVQVLWADNVKARNYFYPGCHRMAPYGTLQDSKFILPETDRLAARVLCLPSGTAVGEREVDGICEILATAIANSKVVREHLRR